MRLIRRRLRDQSGFALPLALSILALIGLLTAAAIGFATHNTDRAIRDLRATRALAAADAGVDAALYRMNKAIVASEIEGLLGLPAAVLAETKCLDISVGQIEVTEPLGTGWCPASSGTEEVDGPSGAGEIWSPASFSYTASTGVNIGVATDDPDAELIERKIVSTGTVDNVSKRVLATAHLRLGSSGNLLAVFEQVGYRQCTPEVPDPGDPASGCG
jgi:type II secretory pathway pseudopilin PulG